MEEKIPSNLQAILWSKNTTKLDRKKDKVYIIHQVLRFGDIENINWLFRAYSIDEIRNVFLEYPLPIYNKSSLNFVGNFLLNLVGPSINLTEQKYVKTLS